MKTVGKNPCQIVDPSTAQDLPCSATEAGGITCENPAPGHSSDQHWVSDHTINHALAGNGYSCASIQS